MRKVKRMVTVKTGERLLLGEKTYDIVDDIDSGKEDSVKRPELRLPSNSDGIRFVSADAPEGVKNVLVGVQNKGYIGLIDFMGGDSSIVQAARTSYGSGTRATRQDRGLIRYLMRHDHTTPFEMVELKFIAKMPIFVARQWVRHRTANINEYSGRYSIMIDESFVPELDSVLGQDTRNRQGSQGELPDNVRMDFINDVETISKEAYERYRKALDAGVSREMARIMLPLSVYTKWYWKNDLHNTFRFLTLRLDTHAQKEIREYAVPMFALVNVVAPIACEAFREFTLEGTRLSGKEQDVLAIMLRGKSFEEACVRSGIELMRSDGTHLKTGEGPELREKIERMEKRAEKLLNATQAE